MQNNEATNSEIKDGSTAASDADTQGSANGTNGNGSHEHPVEAKIAELEAQVKEKESKYLYLYADFENFKKRSVKERSDLIKFGWESVARNLLGVVDNLERALDHMPENTDANFKQGLNMVLTEFRNTLQKQGVQLIETKDKPFDPNLHEAIATEESDLPQGTIVKDHVRGYTLHGRLLRPAQVVVSAGRK